VGGQKSRELTTPTNAAGAVLASRTYMNRIEPPVSNALVLVCEKCGKRLDSESDKNPSRRLVSRLKKMGKKAFGRGEVRAVATSCMDICPEGEISVALVTFRREGNDTRFFTVSGDDAEGTAARILEAVK
jgi:predicted metal-binding protein